MKKSANGNMYEVAAQEAGELFAAHLDGSPLPLVCVLSGKALPEQARAALASSARSLGYGDACAFAALEGPDGTLDVSSLLLLVEGLDPLCLIAADADAARLLSEAYRCPVPHGQPSRIMGRPVVTFSSFASMLANDDDKQAAWALLKKLPRRGA